MIRSTISNRSYDLLYALVRLITAYQALRTHPTQKVIKSRNDPPRMLHLRRRNARYWRLMAEVGITVARKRRIRKDRINVELLVTILGNDRLETMQAEGDARFM